MKDGIYWASQRGASAYLRARADGVAKELAASGGAQPEPGKWTLRETRAAIQNGWQAVAEKLAQLGTTGWPPMFFSLQAAWIVH